MAKTEISKVKHEIFGNCVKIANDIVELWVTVDFGPRIIHFSRIGKENIFYEDKGMSTLGKAFDVYGGEITKLYGGHRLWISPEITPRCYYPDTKPVEFRETANGIEFIAPVEGINHIQKSVTIMLDDDKPTLVINHAIKNCGNWEIELAPWALTMMAAGAVEVIPMPVRETGLLPNRNLVLWDYTAMNDPRVYWGKEYITLRQDTSVARPFKLGFYNEAGWCAVFNKGQVFLKFFEPIAERDYYPDEGCNFESYTNELMLEAESLGAVEYLEPGEWANHVEEWALYEENEVPSNDETEISRIIAKYI
ncbi:MAG: DUF4380 domain-containing protein [Defluviitaleaceae bacterium]|nr:DUF4380 domain-containing protein [Defluviitaleaceae bacterium]